MNDEPPNFDTLLRHLTPWLDQADDLASGRADDAADLPSRLSREKADVLHELIETRVAERTGMLRVLHDVTAILNESRTIRGALQRVLELGR